MALIVPRTWATNDALSTTNLNVGIRDPILDLQPLFARKTLDETVNNSAAFQDDDELFVSVAASTVYEFAAYVVQNSGATPDFKGQWTYPAGLTMRYQCTGYTIAGVLGIFPNDQTSVQTIAGAGADQAHYMTGLVIVSGTAGTLRWQWAQNTANASNTIVRAGSFLCLRKVA